MAEGGDVNRGESRRRLLEGESVEEVVEADAGDRAVDQEGHGRQQSVEAGDRTTRKLKCWYLIALALLIISFVSLLVNICLIFFRNHRVDGAIGAFVSGLFFTACVYLLTYINGLTGRRAIRPTGDYILQRLGQTGTTGIRELRGEQVPVTNVRSPPASLPSINVRNPSASLPAPLPDPAVPGPSGLQSSVRHVSDEHSYRILRSGKKVIRWQSGQASASGESSGTRITSKVASSQSQTPTRGAIRRKIFPIPKAPIHEAHISDDSDYSSSD